MPSRTMLLWNLLLRKDGLKELHKHPQSAHLVLEPGGSSL